MSVDGCNPTNSEPIVLGLVDAGEALVRIINDWGDIQYIKRAFHFIVDLMMLVSPTFLPLAIGKS